MENASKALLMAAGILIGVAVLTLAVYLYASFGGSAETIQKNIEHSQIEQFNNDFIKYTTKKCTVYDILSVVNLANDYNDRNDFVSPSEYYINVYVEDKNGRKQNINNTLNLDTLRTSIIGNINSDIEYSGTLTGKKFVLYKFNCTVSYNESTAKINKILFKKIDENE